MKVDYDLVQRFLFWGCVAAFADAVLGPIFGLVFNVSKLGIFLSLTVIFCGLEFLFTLQKVSPANKAVLVTGCDSGFGLDLAVHLHRLGFLVFAGCLFKDDPPKRDRGQQQLNNGAERLAKVGGIHVLQMDVTSDDQVKQALAYVKANLPADRIFWAVINNAGVAGFGDVEFLSIQNYQRQADVNLWGTIRVTQTFLPMIRKSKGRVVNMASGLGRMCVPVRSIYAITKYGVEAFSDCLRYEVRRFGVDVSIIEPGNFVAATGIFTDAGVTKAAKTLWDNASEEVKATYGEGYFNFRVNGMKGYSKAGSATDKLDVIEAYTKALTDYKPAPRYQPMDLAWKLRCFVATHLPEFVYEYLYVVQQH